MISLLDSPIRFVLCRHEQGRGLRRGRLRPADRQGGECVSARWGLGRRTSSPGVADANMDRSPLVCVIGQGSTRRLHKESHQNMDSVAMFGPITKWAHTIWDAGTVPEVVRKAFKTAEAEKPGATLVELPEDVAKEESDEAPMACAQDPPARRRPQGGGAGGRSHRGGEAAARPRRQRGGPEARGPAAPALRPKDRHRGGQHLHGQGRGCRCRTRTASSPWASRAATSSTSRSMRPTWW